MKSLCITLFVFLTVTAFSQQNFQGKAIYKSKTTMDMNFGGRQMSEDQKKRIADRMKSMLEKTYTLNFTKTESMYTEDVKLGAPGQGGGGFGRMMGSFTGGAKYKNTKEGVVLEETEFFWEEIFDFGKCKKASMETGK